MIVKDNFVWEIRENNQIDRGRSMLSKAPMQSSSYNHWGRRVNSNMWWKSGRINVRRCRIRKINIRNERRRIRRIKLQGGSVKIRRKYNGKINIKENEKWGVRKQMSDRRLWRGKGKNRLIENDTSKNENLLYRFNNLYPFFPKWCPIKTQATTLGSSLFLCWERKQSKSNQNT